MLTLAQTMNPRGFSPKFGLGAASGMTWEEHSQNICKNVTCLAEANGLRMGNLVVFKGHPGRGIFYLVAIYNEPTVKKVYAVVSRDVHERSGETWENPIDEFRQATLADINAVEPQMYPAVKWPPQAPPEQQTTVKPSKGMPLWVWIAAGAATLAVGGTVYWLVGRKKSKRRRKR